MALFTTLINLQRLKQKSKQRELIKTFLKNHFLTSNLLKNGKNKRINRTTREKQF